MKFKILCTKRMKKSICICVYYLFLSCTESNLSWPLILLSGAPPRNYPPIFFVGYLQKLTCPSILPSGKTAQIYLVENNLKEKTDPLLGLQCLTIRTPLVLGGYPGQCCPVQMPPRVSPPCSMIEVHLEQNQADSQTEFKKQDVSTSWSHRKTRSLQNAVNTWTWTKYLHICMHGCMYVSVGLSTDQI